VKDRIEAILMGLWHPRRKVLTDAKRSGTDRRAADRGTTDRRAIAPVTGAELKARLAELNG